MTTVPRRISRDDEWLVDALTGVIVGVKSPVSNSEGLVLSAQNGAVSAEATGVSPSNGATTNTILLQNLLSQGGTVTLMAPGVYLHNQAFVVPNHTRFVLGKGVTLRLATSSNCNQFVGSCTQNALDVGKFSVASGVCTVTEAGRQRKVGDVVYIEGALTNTAMNGAHTVLSVSGNTWAFAVTGSNPTNTSAARIFISAYYPLAATNFVRATNVVTVTEAGHARQIGDQVYVAGLATDTSFNGVGVVTAVVAGVSWTYSSTGSDGSPTGTAQLLGNTGIELDLYGVLDGNLANQTFDQLDGVTITLGNIGNSFITARKLKDGASRSIQLFNAACNIPYVRSVGGKGTVQCESGCNVTIGEVRGDGITDDILAWGITNASGTFGYTASPSGKASMGTLTVDRISGASTTGIFKVFGYTGYDLGTIRVKVIDATGPITLGDTHTETAGATIGAIEIGVLDNPVPANTSQVLLSAAAITSIGKFSVERFVEHWLSGTGYSFNLGAPITLFKVAEWIKSSAATTSVGILIGAAIKVMSLGPGYYTSGQNGQTIRGATGCVVDDLYVTGATHTGASSYGDFISFTNSAQIKRIHLTNVHGQATRSLIAGGTGSPSPIVLLSNVSSNSQGACFNDNGTNMGFTFVGAGFYCDNVGNNVLQLSGTGTSRWAVSDTVHPTGQFLQTSGGTPSVSINSSSVKINLGVSATTPPARLAQVAGDTIYNTNATGAGVYGWTAAGAFQLIY